MLDIIYKILYQPLFNILIFLYNTFGDLGLSVITLTLLVKLLLFPMNLKALRSQKEIKKLQPELEKIKKEYEDDKEAQAQETLKVYKEAKVSPFSGFLPLLLQFPILISLYQIFRRGLVAEEMKHLYDFVAAPETINSLFLGFLDLSSPNMVLAVIAGIGQYIQAQMMQQGGKSKEKDSGGFASIMQSQMKYMLPIFTVVILSTLPAVVGLYWIVNIIFALTQHHMVNSKEDEENKENKEN